MRETRREAGIVKQQGHAIYRECLMERSRGGKRAVSLEPEQFWGGIGGRQKVRTAELKAAGSG